MFASVDIQSANKLAKTNRKKKTITKSLFFLSYNGVSLLECCIKISCLPAVALNLFMDNAKLDFTGNMSVLK